MIWNHVDRFHWRCEDYKKNYAIEVRVIEEDKSEWTVYHNDDKLSSGTASAIIDCMTLGTQFVAKHFEENNVDVQEENTVCETGDDNPEHPGANGTAHGSVQENGDFGLLQR